MIERFHKLSLWLRPVQPLFILLAWVSSLSFGYLLLFAEPELSQRWLLTAVLLAIYCLLLWLIVRLFCAPLPKTSAEVSWSKRWLVRLKRGGYHILALLMMLMLAAAMVLGIRALSGIVQMIFFG